MVSSSPQRGGIECASVLDKERVMVSLSPPHAQLQQPILCILRIETDEEFRPYAEYMQ